MVEVYGEESPGLRIDVNGSFVSRVITETMLLMGQIDVEKIAQVRAY